MTKDLPNIEPDSFQRPDIDTLSLPGEPGHPPRVLMLYGSLRGRSYSRFLTLEAKRVLEALGAEVKVFDPAGLPLVSDEAEGHPKVLELRELSLWSEAQVWCSPERHGAMTGVMKTQIDWLPLAPIGGVRPTQGRTLALMQVSGGSQSFNTVNQMRILGRWMRMITIPNQSSVPRAFAEFDRGRADETVAVLQPHGRCHGGTDEVHPADPRALCVSRRPLLRARGKRRGALPSGQPALDLAPSFIPGRDYTAPVYSPRAG